MELRDTFDTVASVARLALRSDGLVRRQWGAALTAGYRAPSTGR